MGPIRRPEMSVKDYHTMLCDTSEEHSSHYCGSIQVLCDCQVAGITFNLWYRLSEELYQKNNDALTALFKPYVERLIGALCRHCQMEPDHVS
jgi:transportin-3